MNVICLSDVAWNFLWQRQHQLVSRFPKDWQILYVEPSFWKSLALRLINLYSGIKVPNRSNIIVRSVPTFPFFNKSQSLRKINEAILVYTMRFFIRRYHLNESVLLIYSPQFSFLLGELGEHMSCYDIIDEKMDFEAVPPWFENNNKFLISNVNFVTVSGSTLYNRIKSQRDLDVFLVPNGADISHFKNAMLEIQIPEDMKGIKDPILGYIGAIGEWFDFTLLEKILRSYPKISVVLIGWVFNKQRSALQNLSKNYSNLYFLGRRSYDALPGYVKAFKVCIIPFRVYKLTEAVNPIKLYEYLAAGKPVVSTWLPELMKYKDEIFLASTPGEYLEFIDIALKREHDPTNSLSIVSNQDWQTKAQQMVDIIASYKVAARE